MNTREVDVSFDTTHGVVTKRALNEKGALRLAWESAALFVLQPSPHTPDMLGYRSRSFGELSMRYVDGKPFTAVMGMDKNWRCRPMSWATFRPYFEQYVAVEADLLARGALYRDLNPDHLIYARNGHAVLVDHEATLFKTEDMRAWSMHNRRGTWETMAPEEFRPWSEVTGRIATYRAGVLAHVALAGELPFPRLPLREAVYQWRRTHDPLVDATLPHDVQVSLSGALARQPGRRQPDPMTLLHELDSVVGTE